MLQNDQDVARLAAHGCEEIEGSLSIVAVAGSSSEVTSLAGLETIRSVTGQIYVYNRSLVDLAGFSGLETVGGLSLRQSLGMASIDLPALRRVESFDIVALPSLESVHLPLLEVCEGNFNIVASYDSLLEVQANSLVNIGGDLHIALNYVLLTLGGLPSLVSVGGRVTINSNSALPQCEVDAIVQRIGADCNCSGNDNMAVCN